MSLMFPGLGYAYIKKWHWAVSALFFYLLLLCLSCHIYFRIIFKLVTAIHIYIILTKCSKVKDLFRFLLATIVITVLVCIEIPKLITKAFFPMTFAIGSSMEPVSKDGDLIIINKYAYMFKLPEKGDILYFNPPAIEDVNDLHGNLPSNLSKRVVAIGGDQVTFSDSELYVNNKLVNKSGLFHSSCAQDPNGMETLASHKTYIVPREYVFVVGDNFDHSIDSRKFGMVPIDNINGKVVKVFHRIK